MRHRSPNSLFELQSSISNWLLGTCSLGSCWSLTPNTSKPPLLILLLNSPSLDPSLTWHVSPALSSWPPKPRAQRPSPLWSPRLLPSPHLIAHHLAHPFSFVSISEDPLLTGFHIATVFPFKCILHTIASLIKTQCGP